MYLTLLCLWSMSKRTPANKLLEKKKTQQSEERTAVRNAGNEEVEVKKEIKQSR